MRPPVGSPTLPLPTFVGALKPSAALAGGFLVSAAAYSELPKSIRSSSNVPLNTIVVPSWGNLPLDEP